jgi:PAS domain S-box-containing protein
MTDGSSYDSGSLPLSILVLEDDRLWSDLIVEGLGSWGNLQPVYSLQEAITYWDGSVSKHVDEYAADPYSLLIVDLNLGKENGLDFVQYIRNQGCNIPVILMSGDQTHEYAVRAINLGVSKFLQKPLGLQDLQEAINQLLYKEVLTKEKRYQEEYFRSLVEQSTDIILVLDDQGSITYMSPNLPTIYRPEVSVGDSFLPLIQGPDQEQWKCFFSTMNSRNHGSGELTLRMLDVFGSVRWVSFQIRNLVKNPQVKGIVVNGRDITNEKLTSQRLEVAEDILKKKLTAVEQRYATLFELLPVGVSVIDHTGNILENNRAAQDMLEIDTWETTNGLTIEAPGITHKDVDGNVIPPSEYPAALALKEGKEITNQIMHLSIPSQKDRWISVSVKPFIGMDGSTGALVVYPDVTEQIAREKRITQINQELHEITVNLGFLNGWLQKVLRATNPLEILPSLMDELQQLSFLKITGVYELNRDNHQLQLIGTFGPPDWPMEYPLSQVEMEELKEGKGSMHLAFTEQLSKDFEPVVQAEPEIDRYLLVPIYSSGQIQGLVVFGSVLGYSKNTREICNIIAGTLGIVLQKQRVQEQQQQTDLMKRRNEQFRTQADRLMALGSLTSAIGHEINQPLQSIKIIADSTLYWVDTNQEPPELSMLTESLGRISERADWAARVVRSMKMVFQDPGKLIPAELELNQVFKATKDTLFDLLAASQVHVTLEVSPDAATFLFGDIQLRQVLVNLVKNAVRVLSEQLVDQPKIILRSCLNNGLRRIEVEDNGPGIEDALKEKVFDPFYSTAAKTDNMGLGLYVAHTLCKAFSTRIEVVDGELGGAKFILEEDIALD